MSAESPDKPSVRNENHYSLAVQQAVIAAVATGLSLEQAAQEFGIHRNTVQRWCQNVRNVQNPANPLSRDYKPAMRQRAVQAITRALDTKRDPYRAGELGVKVMTGLGEFASGNQLQLDTNLAITIEWGQAQTDTTSVQTVDATPLDKPNTT
jgi:hypothetical protein